MRAGSSLESDRTGELQPGSVLTAQETQEMEDGSKRVRTSIGWITSVNKAGVSMLSPASAEDIAACPVATAAVANDAEGLLAAAEAAPDNENVSIFTRDDDLVRRVLRV